MPEFILDTAGAVTVMAPDNTGRAVTFETLDSFTQGYIEALFFTESSAWYKAEIESDPEGWKQAESEGVADGSIPADSEFGDLAPAALESILQDCASFQRDAAALLERAYSRDYDETQAGRDFWFTRNGHGVGFWDRQELEHDSAEYKALKIPLDQWTPDMARRHSELKAESIGELLSNAARPFGEVYVYIGDDGSLYHG